MTKRKSIDRREFVTTTGAAVTAAALGPTIRIRRREKTLKILQWSHFVPSYDVWFDKYAKDWGTAKGVDVTVDHIDLGVGAGAQVGEGEVIDGDLDPLGRAPVLGVLVEPNVVRRNEVAPLEDLECLLPTLDQDGGTEGDSRGGAGRRRDELAPVDSLTLGH